MNKQQSRDHASAGRSNSAQSADTCSRSMRSFGSNAERQEAIRSSEPAKGGAGGGRVPFGAKMAAAFGIDLSNVKVRLGQTEKMKEIHASAAAEGDELSFASANPTEDEVAHEVAHVAQARKFGAMAGSAVSTPGDASEREAERAASAATRGGSPAIQSRPSASTMRKATNGRYDADEGKRNKQDRRDKKVRVEKKGKLKSKYNIPTKEDQNAEPGSDSARFKKVNPSGKPLFDGESNLIGTVLGECQILTGQVKGDRVLLWNVLVDPPADQAGDKAELDPDIEGNHHVNGWLNIGDLDAATQGEVRAMKVVGDKKPVGKPTHPKKVKADDGRDVKGLHVKAGQADTADGKKKNLAIHYFTRPGGVANVCLNLPNTDEECLGSPSDVVKVDQTFNVVEGMRVPVFLYPNNSGKHAGSLDFVYGHHNNRYGWINERLLK